MFGPFTALANTATSKTNLFSQMAPVDSPVPRSSISAAFYDPGSLIAASKARMVARGFPAKPNVATEPIPLPVSGPVIGKASETLSTIGRPTSAFEHGSLAIPVPHIARPNSAPQIPRPTCLGSLPSTVNLGVAVGESVLAAGPQRSTSMPSAQPAEQDASLAGAISMDEMQLLEEEGEITPRRHSPPPTQDPSRAQKGKAPM